MFYEEATKEEAATVFQKRLNGETINCKRN